MKKSLNVSLAFVLSAALFLTACKNSSKSYADRFEVTLIAIEGGIMISRSTMSIINLGDSSLLDSELPDSQTGKKQSMRKMLTDSRTEILQRMQDLNPPPSEHKDAFDRLRELYAVYEQYAVAMLDSGVPRPFPPGQVAMLEAQAARIQADLKIIKPRSR